MSSYSDFAGAASDILLKKGDALAQGKARSGDIWGNTVATLGDIVPKQVQQVMQQVAAKKKQAQIQSIIQQNGGDLEKSLPLIMGVDANIGAQIGEHVAKVNKDMAEFQKIQTENKKAELDFSDRVLQGVNDEDSYSRWAILQTKLGNKVPDHFDPAYIKQAKENLIEQKKALAEATMGYASSPEGIFSRATGQVSTPAAPKAEPNPTEASIALKAAGGDPVKAMQILKPPPDKSLTPYQVEELKRRDQEIQLSRDRLAQAIKTGNKAAVAKEKNGLADTVMNHPELWGQLTPSEKGQIASELDQRGFKDFKKPLSATMENRLASAKAVVQTGDDITATLKDPKVAAMLGPAMGRFNSLREFIGDPPPELSELAGNIGSFALAQMGVHGMRNAEMAKQIETMLSEKHTPASLAARITGINKFANHLLENEGRSAAPAGPKVGDIKTFPNGNKGRWDGKGWELVK